MRELNERHDDTESRKRREKALATERQDRRDHKHQEVKSVRKTLPRRP